MNPTRDTPLLAGLEQLPAHVCSIYESAEEHFAVLVVVKVVNDLAGDGLVVAALAVDFSDLDQAVAPGLLRSVDLLFSNRLPFVAIDRQLVKFRTGAKRFRVGSLWPAPATRCEDDRPVLAPAEPGSAPTTAESSAARS